jgi:hypothetical protein
MIAGRGKSSTGPEISGAGSTGAPAATGPNLSAIADLLSSANTSKKSRATSVALDTYEDFLETVRRKLRSSGQPVDIDDLLSGEDAAASEQLARLLFHADQAGQLVVRKAQDDKVTVSLP